MARLGSVSVRYMDDWVVLAPTRWKLRMANRAVNQVMADLRVRQHSDKTTIRRIARGSISWSIDFRQSGRWLPGRRWRGAWHGYPSFMSEVRRAAVSRPTCSAGRGGSELGCELQWRMSDRNRPPCRPRAPPKINQTRCKYKREAVT